MSPPTMALNATTTGTSDLNYTYTFGTPYNWTGSGNNTLYLDTNVGAPGSASDRLIISGTAIGQTNIQVWDTEHLHGRRVQSGRHHADGRQERVLAQRVRARRSDQPAA